jgi:NAD(P)-dependent dehydrogenase (short-subunit alcohol dehydrogenase family)
VGTARDLAKAAAATAGVRQAAAAHGGAFELVELDLAQLQSVRRCAQTLLDQGALLDVIIANAGVMATPWGKTADGFETQFGTNHLGPGGCQVKCVTFHMGTRSPNSITN